MSNGNDSHYSGGASSGNSNSGQKFPVSGDFDVDFWAGVWNVSPKTIREWVKKFNIPFWGPSDSNYFIDAEDFKSVFKKPKRKPRRKGGEKT